MRLYFSGCEIPSHRKFLAEQEVQNVSLSYVGLRRRTKFTKPWIVAEQFPEFQNVFLDSGGFTVNKDSSEHTQSELYEISAGYMSFVDLNLDRLSVVTEFDSLALGREWIENMREDFYDDLPEDVFMPIWHSEWSLDYLDDLCQRYKRVGVPKTALDGRTIHQHLNGLVQKYGTKLHGIAMTKPDEMRAVKWDSIASTSWISPSQYGDTVIWTGNELKRYPVKYKEQSRTRHRSYINKIGFDAAKIEDDDTKEVLKLSVWSWKQLEESISKHKGDVVTTVPEQPYDDNAEFGSEVVDTAPEPPRKNISTAVVRRDRELRQLPVMNTIFNTEKFMEDGEEKERDIPLFNMRSQSLRMCDSCFLKDNCPAFESGANCFHGDTLILTRSGIKPISDLEGSVVELLTTEGVWVKAPIINFGKQPLMKISLGRNKVTKTIYATPEHRWILRPYTHSGRRRKEALTKELRSGDKLAFAIPEIPKDRTINPVNVARGFVFGDGTFNKKSQTSVGLFCGEKDQHLMSYFDSMGTGARRPDARGIIYIRGLPEEWKKDLISENATSSDIYGWLAGYFAADGTISRVGQASISCADKETLVHVKTLFNAIGVGTYWITTQLREGFPDRVPSNIYKLGIMRGNLTEDFFVIPMHKDRFIATKDVTERPGWVVKSVETTDRIDTVYCAVVDKTHAFVLEDYILTGNCAYDIPIQVRTKEQMKALYDGIVEMQSQRVLFMKMAEDLEGGIANQDLSKEIDRLSRLIDQKNNMEREGFSVSLEVKGQGGQGALSRIFGTSVGNQAQELPTRIEADRIIENTGVIDAEIV